MKDLDDIMWIAPPLPLNLNDIRSESIRKLGCYLYSKKKLANVPVSKGLIYSCGEYALYRGMGFTSRGSKQSDKINNECLMLQLYSTLLPGDCEFDSWPNGFGKRPLQPDYRYKYLVFPHHGAKMEDKNGYLNCLEDVAVVIIPTGYNRFGQNNNTPSHPSDNSHLFDGKNYVVFQTNPTDTIIVETKKRLSPYYDANAREAAVDVWDPDPQIRKENCDFSFYDK